MSSKSKFIRTSLGDWEINCLPPDLPRIQLVEMQKAFIAGVASMFHALKFDTTDISDDYLDRLDAELTKFFKDDIFKL